ncbi:Uncharacterised protein [Mycobacterium tuberculosis]|uniref:Uncharacterized protein n=1 Tax=Mycobacterium tuberculosis TaxID=1773 RepID=A0A654U0E2_MYCTX|nr:Uncharacterised protein [Mycobacterium tuberculosis]
MAPAAETTTSGRSGLRGGNRYQAEVAVAARLFSP